MEKEEEKEEENISSRKEKEDTRGVRKTDGG